MGSDPQEGSWGQITAEKRLFGPKANEYVAQQRQNQVICIYTVPISWGSPLYIGSTCFCGYRCTDSDGISGRQLRLPSPANPVWPGSTVHVVSCQNTCKLQWSQQSCSKHMKQARHCPNYRQTWTRSVKQMHQKVVTTADGRRSRFGTSINWPFLTSRLSSSTDAHCRMTNCRILVALASRKPTQPNCGIRGYS